MLRSWASLVKNFNLGQFSILLQKVQEGRESLSLSLQIIFSILDFSYCVRKCEEIFFYAPKQLDTVKGKQLKSISFTHLLYSENALQS